MKKLNENTSEKELLREIKEILAHIFIAECTSKFNDDFLEECKSILPQWMKKQ